jgi:cytochrome c-type biogenesis protein
VLGHALFFVLGFTTVFVFLFGLPATLLGQGLFRYRDWIARIGGAVLIAFGLHTIGLISIPILNATWQIEAPGRAKPGHARSFLIGVTFAAGWTPCIGPLLGAVMTLALAEPAKGMAYLLVYALGLAAPFLAVAALLTPAIRWLKRLNRHMHAIKTASGVLMIVIGLLLLSGTLSLLSRMMTRFTPQWLLELI